MADATAADELWANRIVCLEHESLAQESLNAGPDLERQFDRILQAARDRLPVAELLRDLLGKIDTANARSALSLPGRPVIPTGVTVYICPLDACDRISGRQRPGAPKPSCNVHNLALKHARLS